MAFIADAHKHAFTKVAFRRVPSDNLLYTGLPGQYAMIVEVCDCGKEKGMEYGPRDEMIKLYGEIREKRQAKAEAKKETTDVTTTTN